MDDDATVSVDYALFERLVAEQCTASAPEFPPGDVLLPESPLSIGALLAEAAGVDENDGAFLDTRFVYEFESEKAEEVASFTFWSDGVTMYLYRMSDGRCCICWLGEDDLVGLALLRDERVWPLFFEEVVASCGDCVHIVGWGSLPEELSVTVSDDTLLRATFRFLLYADNGAAWHYYARLGRAGEMPVVLPGSMPAWVREQDKAYWDEAYEFVRDTIGFAGDSER